MTYHYKPIRMVKMKKRHIITSVGKNVEQLENRDNTAWNLNLKTYLGKLLAVSSKTEKTHDSQSSNFISGYTPNRNVNFCTQKEMYNNVHSSMICNNFKWKQKGLSTIKQINNIWHTLMRMKMKSLYKKTDEFSKYNSERKKKPDTSNTWEARHLKGIFSLVNNVIDGVRSQVSSYSWESISGRRHKEGFCNLVTFCFLNQSLVNGQIHFMNIHHAVHLGLCAFLYNDINHQNLL